MCTVPVTVAKQSFLGLSASMSPVAVYTPPAAGDFMILISTYATPFVGSGGGSGQAGITYTDPDVGAWSAANTAANPASVSSSIAYIRSAGSQPINVTSIWFSSDPTETYNVYITIIQI